MNIRSHVRETKRKHQPLWYLMGHCHVTTKSVGCIKFSFSTLFRYCWFIFYTNFRLFFDLLCRSARLLRQDWQLPHIPVWPVKQCFTVMGGWMDGCNDITDIWFTILSIRQFAFQKDVFRWSDQEFVGLQYTQYLNFLVLFCGVVIWSHNVYLCFQNITKLK